MSGNINLSLLLMRNMRRREDTQRERRGWVSMRLNPDCIMMLLGRILHSESLGGNWTSRVMCSVFHPLFYLHRHHRRCHLPSPPPGASSPFLPPTPPFSSPLSPLLLPLQPLLFIPFHPSSFPPSLAQPRALGTTA